MKEVRRLAPVEAMVAVIGALLVVGGILGTAWLVPSFFPGETFGGTFLRMLGSAFTALIGVGIYLQAGNIQSNRLDREEGA